jgi:tetratricopeptide (TPR) repeat protein
VVNFEAGRRGRLLSYYLPGSIVNEMTNAFSQALIDLKVRTALLLLLSMPFTVNSQTMSPIRILEPPRKGLVTVDFPDLSQLEQNVREQIAASQNSLVAATKDSSTSEAILSEAYGNLAQLYHAYSLTSPARECYMNASHLSQKDFRWIYLLGKLDQQAGIVDEAIDFFRVARALNPTYLPLLVNLGNILLESNRLEEAREIFTEALKLDENDPATHYGLGQVAMSQRNYSDAAAHFEKTLAQLPAANRVHYSLAMAYRGLGDSNRVTIHLAQQGSVGVKVSDPLVDGLQSLIEGERVHLSRGKVAFEAQRYQEASIEFRKAVAAKPDSVPARVNLGAALTKTGDPKGAVEQFEEAVRLDPTATNAHYNLAILFSGQNDHEDAISHLRAVLRLDANDQGARFLLGQELRKVNRLDEALAEFQNVVHADPNNETAVLENVKLLHFKGQYKQALEVLEKSEAQFPQKGRTAVMLSYLLATSPATELRDGTRAFDLAQRVYKATGALQHVALVALALSELGRCDEAAEWQRRMIATGEQQNVSSDLLAGLTARLKLNENKQTCRPTGDKELTNLSFFEIDR